METGQKDLNKFGKPKLTYRQKAERIIIYGIIWIACWHICHDVLRSWGNWDILMAILWTGNILFLKDFSKWMSNQ